MALGKHRKSIGTDFIRDVAIGRHPIAADQDRVDFSLLHHVAGHIVCD